MKLLIFIILILNLSLSTSFSEIWFFLFTCIYVWDFSLIILEELKKILEIIPEKQKLLSGSLSDLTFMFTGKLEGISRAEAKSLIENNSGKIISNVSSKLDFLVIGKKPTLRKVSEAKNLKIKVITQSELIEMINSKVV